MFSFLLTVWADGEAFVHRHGAEVSEPSAEHDLVAREIVDAAFCVHTSLGPGLLESVYADCLAYDLEDRGIVFSRQVGMPLTYRNRRVGGGLRMDMVVGGLVVVEIKAVERILPVHEVSVKHLSEAVGS